MNVSFADSAKQYLDRGWKVFPIAKGEKRPLTDHGHKDASSDREQVRIWSEMFPDANIGIATGRSSGILVIDIDGDEGLASYRQVKDRLNMPDTPVVKSSRGWHLYFRDAGHAPSSQGRLGKGIDIRANGGSITAPPSVHASGHIYRWLRPLTDDPLPTLPVGLFLDVYRPRAYVHRRPIETPDLRELVDRVKFSPEGFRNKTLNVSSFQAGKLIREGRASYEAAYQALYEAAVDAGLDRHEIKSTLRSGIRAGENSE